MFSIRREQGRLAELAPVIRILAADATARGPWRPGSSRVLVELGMEDGGAARARARRRRRARPVPRVALARLAHLPDRRLRGARRRGHRRARLPGARAARRDERDDRPPGRLLRSGRPLPRHARRDARRVGPRRGALRARHGAQPAHGGARPGSPTPPTSTRACCWRAAPASAIGPTRCSARRRRWPSAIGMPALLGRIRALGVRGADRPAVPTGSPRARSQILRPRRAGPQQPRDRRRRCSSASTRPPTTSAASCARPAARTAPRRPPTPTGTASSRPSGPRYDLRDAALRDRARPSPSSSTSRATTSG